MQPVGGSRQTRPTNEVAVESIARLGGHEQTVTTQLIYRNEIRPALMKGAEVMHKIFG